MGATCASIKRGGRLDLMVSHPTSTRMVLCPSCGNKRCPKANDHHHECTWSNDSGQLGSAYPSFKGAE